LNRFYFRVFSKEQSLTLSLALVYRQNQILAALNNIILQDGLLLTVFEASLLISFCMTILIKMQWTLETLIVIPLCISLVACGILALLVWLGCMVGIYVESKQLFRRLMNNSNIGISRGSRIDRKWTRKFCMSCMPIKIKIGSSNFIEQGTPLNCFNSAVGLTVNILMVSST